MRPCHEWGTRRSLRLADEGFEAEAGAFEEVPGEQGQWQREGEGCGEVGGGASDVGKQELLDGEGVDVEAVGGVTEAMEELQVERRVEADGEEGVSDDWRKHEGVVGCGDVPVEGQEFCGEEEEPCGDVEWDVFAEQVGDGSCGEGNEPGFAVGPGDGEDLCGEGGCGNGDEDG